MTDFNTKAYGNPFSIKVTGHDYSVQKYPRESFAESMQNTYKSTEISQFPQNG